MGWREVFVLAETGTETGWPQDSILGDPPHPELGIDAAQLPALIAKGQATVVDLSLSPAYRKGHIQGAWFAIRSRLAQALAKIPIKGELVLTSEDGVLAGLATRETGRPARYLRGGNAAWVAAGHELSTDLQMADEPLDAWLKPYERPGDSAGAMSEYLAWETDLLPRIARDGSCRFTNPR